MNSTVHKDQSLNSFLVRSFWLHLSLILCYFLFYLLTKFSLIPDWLSPTKVVFVEPAIRVDVVAMPTMTLDELAQVKLTEQTSIEVKKESAPIEKQKSPELTSQDFSSLLKKLSSKKTVDSKNDPKKISSELKELVLAGNRLSKGTALVGKNADQISDEFSRYLMILPDHVRKSWRLPSYLLKSNNRCRVQIFLDGSGQLLTAKIYESSGDEEYDRFALAAIESSSPFPVPPKAEKDRVGRGTIVLGFPL